MNGMPLKKLNQMKKRIQNYLRKKRHLRYISLYITDLRWEIINTVTSSAHTGFNEGTSKHLYNLGNLIRKYERRKRLLKF